MPSRVGLTIGVGYQGTKVSALKGTVNDSLNMAQTLKSKYSYKITNINDQHYAKGHARYPSKNNILFWLNKLLRECKDGDEIFIGYAGHGVQLRLSNDNTEELDRKDEAIIPADYDFKETSAITDDEIQRILAIHLNSKPNCKVFILFDCCHSGTMADLRYRFNYHHNRRDFTFHDNKKANSFKAKVILVSGCRDDQVSWGDLVSLSGGSKTRQGVMTSAFLHVIGRNPSSIKNVFEIVKEMYRYTSPYKQQPQVSSNYDISKSRDTTMRNIIEYGANTITNPSPVRPTRVRPTPVKPTRVRPTPVKPTRVRPTPVKPTRVRPTVSTKKNSTLSTLLNMYSSSNRYRYRYRNRNRYRYRNRYRNRYRYRYRYRKRLAENDNTELGSKHNIDYEANKSSDVMIRPAGKIPSLDDIIAMVV
jgi:caspase domain-containing protein